MHPIAATLRQFFMDNAWLDKDEALGEHDSLLEKGVIDSVAMMELIDFLEETYGIDIPDDDLMPDNFDTLAAIVAYVTRKQQVVRP